MRPHSTGRLSRSEALQRQDQIEEKGGIAWMEDTTNGHKVMYFSAAAVAEAFAKQGIGKYVFDIPIPGDTTFQDVMNRVEGVRGWAYPTLDAEKGVIHVEIQVEPAITVETIRPAAVTEILENVNDELVPYGWSRISAEDLKPAP